MISDPFKVLGVRDDCSDADLKKAYREKSKKWHPDQNPGKEEYAEKRFQEVQEAYRQIQDARQRGTSAYGSPRGAGYGGGNTSRINISRAAIRTDAVMRIMEHTMTSLINGSHTLSREGSRRRRRRPLRSRQPAAISITGLTGRL